MSITLYSLPSGPGACISNTCVLASVQRVFMCAVVLPLVIGSFHVPVKLQFPLSSQSPSLIITPVLMLSFQVDQCLPETLS